jgi:DNA (cytosine-5)-methyltransferase 1
MAGAKIVGGVDAWKLATETFQLNFPEAEVWNERAEDIDPEDVAARVGRVDLLLASPECTSHSVAKGSAPRCEISRETAFQVIRYARAFKPRWIVVENVPRMTLWARFQDWMAGIHELGYQTCHAVLDAQDYRTPQSRKRLFILCDKEVEPTLPPKARGPKRTVASILRSGEPRVKPWAFRPVDSAGRAEATIERAERAIKAFGPRSEFIMVYYGSDGAGGYQSLDRPLRTVTTLDRFAYVRPNGRGHEMRMLQPPELAAAMGFPPLHQWARSNRRDRIRLIGNAVCPPVMCSVVRHLTGQAVSTSATVTLAGH